MNPNQKLFLSYCFVSQVQCNLFAVNSSGSPAKEAWFVCKEVQDNYQQHSGKKGKCYYNKLLCKIDGE